MNRQVIFFVLHESNWTRKAMATKAISLSRLGEATAVLEISTVGRHQRILRRKGWIYTLRTFVKFTMVLASDRLILRMARLLHAGSCNSVSALRNPCSRKLVLSYNGHVWSGDDPTLLRCFDPELLSWYAFVVWTIYTVWGTVYQQRRLTSDKS